MDIGTAVSLAGLAVMVAGAAMAIGFATGLGPDEPRDVVRAGAAALALVVVGATATLADAGHPLGAGVVLALGSVLTAGLARSMGLLAWRVSRDSQGAHPDAE